MLVIVVITVMALGTQGQLWACDLARAVPPNASAVFSSHRPAGGVKTSALRGLFIRLRRLWLQLKMQAHHGESTY